MKNESNEKRKILLCNFEYFLQLVQNYFELVYCPDLIQVPDK